MALSFRRSVEHTPGGLIAAPSGPDICLDRPQGLQHDLRLLRANDTRSSSSSVYCAIGRPPDRSFDVLSSSTGLLGREDPFHACAGGVPLARPQAATSTPVATQSPCACGAPVRGTLPPRRTYSRGRSTACSAADHDVLRSRAKRAFPLAVPDPHPLTHPATRNTGPDPVDHARAVAVRDDAGRDHRPRATAPLAVRRVNAGGAEAHADFARAGLRRLHLADLQDLPRRTIPLVPSCSLAHGHADVRRALRYR